MALLEHDVLTPAILLVEPAGVGNVGAAARAMANFGLTDLRVVGSPDMPADRDYRAARIEGRPILERLKEAPRPATLAEALADIQLPIAVTRRRGKHRPADRAPFDLAPLLAAQPAGTTTALVFGREADGLTVEELDLCGRRLTIPTTAEAPSLNLAQAVGVVTFAWFSGTAAAAEAAARTPPGAGAPDPPAPVPEVEAFLAQLEPALERIGFFEGDRGPDGFRSLRRIFTRAGLTVREVRLLRGLARKIAEFR